MKALTLLLLMLCFTSCGDYKPFESEEVRQKRRDSSFHAHLKQANERCQRDINRAIDSVMELKGFKKLEERNK